LFCRRKNWSTGCASTGLRGCWKWGRGLPQEPALSLSKGRLELFDLQPEMLEKTRRRLETAGLHNVGFTQGDASHLPFRENQFDVVFLVAVLGEMPHPATCLQGIYRTLQPAGLLSITEQPGDPDFMPLATVRALAEQQGFEFIGSYGQGKNYTVNFKKETQNEDKSDGS
jgi:ubiquinone/menaquinone biosynthesis C-methylase UbiE